MTGTAPITVKVMSELDKPMLRDHLTACWRAHYGALFGTDVANDMIVALAQDDVAGLMTGDDEVGLCVRSGREIIATCFGAERAGVGYVWGCYVRPSWRRRGLGRRLLRDVQAELEAPVVVAHVLDASTQAQAFYRALGFVPEDRTDYEIVPGDMVPATVMTIRPNKVPGFAAR